MAYYDIKKGEITEKKYKNHWWKIPITDGKFDEDFIEMIFKAILKNVKYENFFMKFETKENRIYIKMACSNTKIEYYINEIELKIRPKKFFKTKILPLFQFHIISIYLMPLKRDIWMGAVNLLTDGLSNLQMDAILDMKRDSAENIFLRGFNKHLILLEPELSNVDEEKSELLARYLYNLNNSYKKLEDLPKEKLKKLSDLIKPHVNPPFLYLIELKV